MTPRMSKTNLLAHVVTSVGWFGSVAAFLCLSIAGKVSRSPDLVRGAYLSLNVIGLYVVIPMAILAFATGLIQSFGTEWGLRRFYWVLVKFWVSLGATLLLILHQFTVVTRAAHLVMDSPVATLPDLGKLPTKLLMEAGLASLLLPVLAYLSIFKPWGKTRYGNVNAKGEVAGETAQSLQRFLIIGLLIVLLVLAIMHAHHGGHAMH